MFYFLISFAFGDELPKKANLSTGGYLYSNRRRCQAFLFASHLLFATSTLH